MSNFQYILSAAQLTKHYEVLQFLAQHPNQEYTLAQLDTLLPHGVAVQRFPEEWFHLVEEGACWHRSIELLRPAASSGSGDGDGPTGSPLPEDSAVDASDQQRSRALSVLEASAAAAHSTAARRAQYVLFCAKAEIHTLDELRARLESPSTLLDAEGCVALHTDQIIIAPELLRRAQRTGLVYFFPDVYDKNEFRQFGVKDTAASSSPTARDAVGGNGGGARANAGQATSALLAAFTGEEESGKRKLTNSSGSGSGSRDRTYIALPPGIRVQHQLLTRRGVTEQEEYCLPTKLLVGERLRLLFDNLVAVKKLHLKNELQVQLSMAGVKVSKGEGVAVGAAAATRPDALSAEPPPPLRIRKETQAVRHAAIASPPPPPMAPPPPLLVSTTTKVEMEALYACTLTLLLTVNGVENVLAVEVVAETATMPGVLILRDRQLDSFALPRKDTLMDPMVNPPMEFHYPFESVVQALSSSTASAVGAEASAVENSSWSELVPLPWTQNPSPVVLSLREGSYPTQHSTVQAATRAVFSAQSLADEARLRQTKDRLRREAERREGAGAGRKRRRMRYRDNMILSNRHLLHFGFDFSIPFARQPD
ncbi:hypothetical protein ABB37_08654 [Leptomonas pyrrhocoris]|uniref:TFIIH basal transcription factor subunit n=1 Tax=Leptomonas pyrrhocoris TaxID=157538 RepID=A0A0M9FSW2_LEPPY|nr:hypothetical protein ABB37_08654 [Leptomonas pyrrhocoris]KPA75375.1 hypothetical protein ABB37_08654 [Leptomonas pyrrhocoris]|eukprot:XP_015653814.1 hypothetical protein ABB37_08654 [Leptomonas pyrrhocoris]